MTKVWLLVVCTALAGVHASDLSDFSNNLASDIGPLLALFGESMTKQYLAESTSFLDYFIFAMAPIGILTAIVSAIRVCGHSSLRAFIGRSQEGDGVVEAELCTSTSRDVCELFNRGGITRVLGRPTILELVQVETHDMDNDDKAGLFLFRNYLNTPGLSETSDWRVQRSRFDSKGEQACSIAPTPNLSLNVGIVKRPKWVFVAFATIGFVLQAGVLVLAGVGVWVLHWNLEEGDTSASRDYAPAMFIAGTVLMCSGMWSCAALIGQTTCEVRYKRQSDTPRTRLLWLQPGPQEVGNQSFDPFAYLEKEEKRLEVWTSSKKDFIEKFEGYTFIAVLIVLIGYIMQFIGLRGMKAWVSLAQLAITIIMSILRGSLRMQRLSRGDNELAKMPVTVAGYELDWLAFKITKQDHQEEPFWHITGQHEKAVRVEKDRLPSLSKEGAKASLGPDAKRIPCLPCCSKIQSRTVENAQTGCKDLVQARVRLAHLTGHIPFSGLKEGEYQKWEDDYVKVRTKATRLSAAICFAAESLLPKRAAKKDIMLKIKAVNSPCSGGSDHHKPLIDVMVTLKPPEQSSSVGWTIDSARIEAILGLWMWSLVSAGQSGNTEHDSPQNGFSDNKFKINRIISAGPDNDSWNHKTNRQAEMDLWLGPDAVNFSTTTLALNKDQNYSLSNRWVYPFDKSSDCKSMKEVKEDLPHGNTYRFCGWNPVYKSLNSEAAHLESQPTSTYASVQLKQEARMRIQYASTICSLVEICSQELFVALTISLARLLPMEQTTLMESNDNVRLNNPTVDALTKAFVAANLGSYPDALLCIIPAFGAELHQPTPEEMLSALIKEAETHRQRSEWEQAQTLLRWACNRYSGKAWESNSVPGSNNLIGNALRVTGELYRWSLAQNVDDERKRFGKMGVDWMIENFRDQHRRSTEIQKILDCYQEIARRNALQDTGSLDKPSDPEQSLIMALRDRNRTETLYYLSFITTGAFGSQHLQQALPLAVRNDWSEVISAMLEMKANPNSQDRQGRTAISYCAELGYESYVERLIDLGASLDQEDKHRRTPLFWAAGNGHFNVAKLLLNTPQVDRNRAGPSGFTPLMQASRNEYLNMIELLIEHGANLESKDKKHGKTALLWAAEKGNAAVVQLLLEKGAKLESKDRKHGKTALSWAVSNGHLAVVQLLLDKRASLKSDNDDGRTPLIWALDNDKDDIVQLLLEHAVKIESTDDKYGQTLLSWAAEKGHQIVVQLLLEKGANLELRDYEYGGTPLLWAAKHNHSAIVQLLLEKGAKVDSEDKDGRTPLSWAAENEQLAVVQLLLGKEANVESVDKHGRTPLSWASDNRDQAVVQLLLEKGASLEMADKDGRTPLSWASSNGDQAVVQLLLEEGASLESADKDGRMPLSWASANRSASTLQLLFNKGANVESADKDGRTSLSWAAANGNSNAVQLLHDNGANLESKDKNGWTPLWWAAKNNKLNTAFVLHEKGASLESEDKDGKTPMAWATENGYQDMLHLLNALRLDDMKVSIGRVD